MGADYYIYTNLVVTYSNDEEDYIQLDSQRSYYVSDIGQYDSDSEGARDRAYAVYKEKTRKEKDNCCSSKLLYEDGKWLITSKEKIELYEKLVQESQINNEKWSQRFVGADVKKICKVVSAH